jgi:hypothetical protein
VGNSRQQLGASNAEATQRASLLSVTFNSLFLRNLLLAPLHLVSLLKPGFLLTSFRIKSNESSISYSRRRNRIKSSTYE